MTNDWKLVLNVLFGSVVLVMVVIIGLSRMANGESALKIDESLLMENAKLVKENGEVKVTVVNFSDVECPACRQAHELTLSLAETAGVRYVFRHYPLSMHKHSFITASAVESARLMGKGFEMLSLLFEKQGEWSAKTGIEDRLAEYAISLGLDETEFVEKLKSSEVTRVVQQDIALGDSLKLLGTPTVYVNGEPVAANFVVTKVNQLLKEINGN
jgi:protein-disulfide isomerase